MPGRVIYVVRSWPRLSQTFVVNEVLALERRGAELEIFALEPSGETLVQPQVAAVRAPVTYLGPAGGGRRLARLRDHAAVAARSPLRYAAAAWQVWRDPGLCSGYTTTTARQCLDHAVEVAARIRHLQRRGVRVAHVHAHFAHDPALVGMLVGRLTAVPYSITAHARDLYQTPARGLAARTGGARAVLTCCRRNEAYLREVLPPSHHARVRVVRHGVEVSRFTPASRVPSEGPTRVVSVGRLVEKKGFPDLLQACALAAAGGARFTLTVYGDGPLRGTLERMRDDLGLAGVVELAGERDHDVVRSALRAADLFALTPFVTDDGDADGVPNVVVEAMACGLPVVATAVGGVPEAVTHGRTGLLAPPRDVPVIAAHLAALVGDAGLRRRLGSQARRIAEQGFDVDAAAQELAQIFGISEGVR